MINISDKSDTAALPGRLPNVFRAGSAEAQLLGSLGDWTVEGRGERSEPVGWRHRIPVPRATSISSCGSREETTVPFRVLLDGDPPGMTPLLQTSLLREGRDKPSCGGRLGTSCLVLRREN